MIRLSALTLRARLVKPYHQIDAGFIGFVNEPTVIGRPELQAIQGMNLVEGVELMKDKLPGLQPDQLAGQRIGRCGHRHIAPGGQFNLDKIDGQIGAR